MKRWRHFVKKSCPAQTFRIDASACLLGALAVLILPLNWILAALIAALWHESCHWLALKFCGCPCYGISIGADGAVLDTAITSPWKEVLCAFAGPLGSLLLLTFYRWIPRIALCALFQGLYNLIPVYPLDGGRVVCGLLKLLLKNGKLRIFTAAIEVISMALLTVLSLSCLTVLRLGYLPLLLVILLGYRVFRRKYSCKEGQLAVQ